MRGAAGVLRDELLGGVPLGAWGHALQLSIDTTIVVFTRCQQLCSQHTSAQQRVLLVLVGTAGAGGLARQPVLGSLRDVITCRTSTVKL